MIAKSSTGEESPARASSSEAQGSDDVWCTSGSGVSCGCSVLATGCPTIAPRSSRNFASPPVITPTCCSPAAMARQRSLSSDSWSTPRSDRMLRADGQPSASATSLPGLRYSHIPCGTEIDSICASSASDPASAAARRTARTMSCHGSAHCVGSSDVSCSKPIPTITGVFGVSSFIGRSSLLAGVDGLALLHWGIPLSANNHEVACAGYYSNLSSTLTAVSGGSPDFALQLFPLQDTADDGAPDGSRPSPYTPHLGGCLRAAGVDPAGLTLVLDVTATGESRPGGVDRTAQFLHVTMP